MKILHRLLNERSRLVEEYNGLVDRLVEEWPKAGPIEVYVTVPSLHHEYRVVLQEASYIEIWESIHDTHPISSLLIHNIVVKYLLGEYNEA